MKIKLRKNSTKSRLKKLERELFETNSSYWLSATTKERLDDGYKRLSKLEIRVAQLESIIEDAGIVEDVDMSDVKYREKEIVLEGGLFGPQKYTQKIPYVVNEVKVK